MDHPVLGKLEKTEEITFIFDGKSYTGFKGDTVASALLAHGFRQLRVQEESGNPRGIYCNIGHCFECRVTINHVEGVRSCMTPIEHNMVVESGRLQPVPFKSTEADKLPRTYAEFERGLHKEDDPHV